MWNHSETVSSDSLSELKVLRHDGDSLSVNSAQVGVLEKRNQVGLSCFLEGQNCLTLESDFLFELGRNLPNQSLEGKLPDQQVSLNKSTEKKGTPTAIVGELISSYALLEFSDLSQSNCSGFESVGLLDSGDDGGRLPGDFLGRKLLAGYFLGCGLPCSLLGASHLQ